MSGERCAYGCRYIEIYGRLSRADRAEPSLGVVLKPGGTAAGDLCARGARHPRVARAGVCALFSLKNLRRTESPRDMMQTRIVTGLFTRHGYRRPPSVCEIGPCEKLENAARERVCLLSMPGRVTIHFPTGAARSGARCPTFLSYLPARQPANLSPRRSAPRDERPARMYS